MPRNALPFTHLTTVLVAVAAHALPCLADDGSYARRAYRLGDTMSHVAATEYPDDNDWPGGRLFFSAEETPVWGDGRWLPLDDIRAAMHASWRKDGYTAWVPIKAIRDILPFEFTPEELEGNPEPYRIDKKHRIRRVKEKDLEKYADVLHYQHPPQAELPSMTYYGPWADAGVIKGQFYYPKIDRTRRADGMSFLRTMDP